MGQGDMMGLLRTPHKKTICRSFFIDARLVFRRKLGEEHGIREPGSLGRVCGGLAAASEKAHGLSPAWISPHRTRGETQDPVTTLQALCRWPK